MQQLSSLDAQFLHVESPTTVGHVGSLLVLDPSTAPDGQLTLDAVREVLEPRLHLAAVLRQRLVMVPLSLGLPYWVDDPDFDIEFHLREIGLPGPGDDQQLAEQVARIHARPLDRTRPLWEMYLIHGLEDRRQALYTKVHHAAIDGVSGAEILATVMDTTVEPRVEEPPAEYWDPAPLPTPLSLFGRGLSATAAQPLETLRILPKTLPHLADLPGATFIPGVELISDLADALLRPTPGEESETGHNGERRTVRTPPTPLNGTITAHRRFAYGSLPLDEIKTVKNAFDMTVNDVVMAVCATALRSWLLDHDGLPQEPIVIAVPVSVRGADLLGANGNQVSVMLVEIPTQLADPGERLAGVRRGLEEAKTHFEAVPATILQDVASVLPTALAGLAARAVFRVISAGPPPFNLFVSNVPGPQFPLYVAGAKVLGIYPASAITDFTGALNITLFSYDGRLDFGLIACRELVPDVWNLIGYLRDALDELLRLAKASGHAEPPAAAGVSKAAGAARAARTAQTAKTARTAKAARSANTAKTANAATEATPAEAVTAAGPVVEAAKSATVATPAKAAAAPTPTRAAETATPAKAAKTAKTAKVATPAKAVTPAKAAKTAKAAKVATSARAAKTARTAKAAKAAKAAKVATPTKAAKLATPAKAAKTTRTAKAAKVATPTKAVKAAKPGPPAKATRAAELATDRPPQRPAPAATGDAG